MIKPPLIGGRCRNYHLLFAAPLWYNKFMMMKQEIVTMAHFEDGYVGDGFSNDYDYNHPVHGDSYENAVLSGSEPNYIDDTQYVDETEYLDRYDDDGPQALFTAQNRGTWQALANSVAPQRPSKGKRVMVTGGRKHLGKSGIVTWHGVDKYVSRQYWTDAQYALREMTGRYGYRVGVRTDTGETFFVSADYVTVIDGQES